MSSFICSPKHFNSLENAIISLTDDNNFRFPYSFKETFPTLYDSRNFTSAQIKQTAGEIVDTLRSLNALCVTLKYKHHYAGTLDTEIESQTRTLMSNKKAFTHLNKIALFKSLRCVNYQIEIESLKELRDLTELETNAMFFMKEFCDALAYHIIGGLDAYDKAPWGID
jgi:hypothetical protein